MRRAGAALLALVATPALAQTVERAQFAPNVRTAVEGDVLVVESNGLPSHATGTFPGPGNPNRIVAQAYRFYLPLRPQEAAQPSAVPRGGPIAVALSGVPFYNPNDAEGRNAVEGPYREMFDPCMGHPDPGGRYHYHQYSPCIVAAAAPGHAPVIGYAFDGFAIYGLNGADGRPPADLDSCNGHRDGQRGYHYHVTARHPYVLGCYRGTADRRNLDRSGGGMPPPRGGRPPPGGPPPGGGPMGPPR